MIKIVPAILLVTCLFTQNYQLAESRIYQSEITVFHDNNNISDTLFVYQDLNLDLEWSWMIPIRIIWDDEPGMTRTYIVSNNELNQTWYLEMHGNEVNWLLNSSQGVATEFYLTGENPYFRFFCNEADCQERTGTLVYKLEAVYNDESFGGLNGDWNFDGEVNVIDIVMIVDYILQG